MAAVAQAAVVGVVAVGPMPLDVVAQARVAVEVALPMALALAEWRQGAPCR